MDALAADAGTGRGPILDLILGRIAPGSSVSDAQSELDAIGLRGAEPREAYVKVKDGSLRRDIGRHLLATANSRKPTDCDGRTARKADCHGKTAGTADCHGRTAGTATAYHGVSTAVHGFAPKDHYRFVRPSINEGSCF